MPFFLHERASSWARTNQESSLEADEKETEFIEDPFYVTFIRFAEYDLKRAYELYELPYEFIFKSKKLMEERDIIKGYNPNYNTAILKRAQLGIKD